MTRHLLFLASLFIYFSLFAEDAPFTINGTIIDSSNNTGVSLASVALKAPGKSAILAATTADLDGKFSLKIAKGRYDLMIIFIGYDTKTVPIEVNGNLKLGKIFLLPSQNTLKEAVVIGQRTPEITIDAEKEVYNLSQSITSQTGTAEDALRNMPGVSVDQDGNISIVGKQGVKVLVDGKPNAMADNDLPSFLRSLPANSIESIEVITSPSAKYDAGGNAGIINIKLKKGKLDGLNVYMSASAGILNRYNGSTNVNYRKKKFNVFTNYSANESDVPFKSSTRRTITAGDSASYYNSSSTGTQKSFSNNLKAGFDYFANDNNTLTYTVTGNYSHSNTITNGSSATLDSAEEPSAINHSVNQALRGRYFINNDLSYVRKFDSTDRELDVQLGHSYSYSANNTNLSSPAFDVAGIYDTANSLFQKTNSPSSSNDIMLKVDYTHPFPKLKGYRLETGFKDEATINNNVFDDYQNNVSNPLPYNDTLSNKFGYVQNIAAAYGVMHGAYKKWLRFSGGLRAEQTYINGNDHSVDKDYINFFPSASTSVAFNDTQNLSVSYNRRIQRPPFNYINNQLIYSDPYTTWQGNPLLQPSFANNLSLAYSHSVGKHLFVLRAGGTIVNNGFTNIATVDTATLVTHGTEVNGVNSKACNVSFYMRLHLTSWWEAQGYYNFSYTYYDMAPGINLSSNAGGTNNIWGMMRFKFWTNAAFELSGWCNTRSFSAEGYTLPVGSMNASIKKSFMKDHLTVALSANDILSTMKWQWVQENEGIQSTGTWQNASRFLMMTLSYRFGTRDFEERKENEAHEGENGG